MTGSSCDLRPCMTPYPNRMTIAYRCLTTGDSHREEVCKGKDHTILLTTIPSLTLQPFHRTFTRHYTQGLHIYQQAGSATVRRPRPQCEGFEARTELRIGVNSRVACLSLSVGPCCSGMLNSQYASQGATLELLSQASIFILNRLAMGAKST